MSRNSLAVDVKQGWAETTIGSRPGDTFGDIVFSFVASRIDKKIQDDLRAHDLVPVIPYLSTFGIGDVDCSNQIVDRIELAHVSFVDDMAACVISSKVDSITDDVGRASGIIVDACAIHGISCNFKAGKSE